MIEILDSRIAPATLVAGLLTYTDVDGDLVTIKVKTKATLSAANFTFAAGFLDGDTTTPQQLQTIDLSVDPKNDGASITAKVTQAGAGNGKVNIGYINATGRDLGTVIVPGDLGQIDCGDTLKDAGLGKLSVDSMGVLGTTTQAGGGSLVSRINGPLKTLLVAGDLAGDLRVLQIDKPANLLGKVVIGGNLDGTSQGLGDLTAEGDIGNVTIKGKILGGSVADSGRLDADDKIGKVTVGVPPKGTPPPPVTAVLVGGSGNNSGVIEGGDVVGSVTIYGTIQGSGVASGQIISGGSSIKKVLVTGDVRGGTGADSGLIEADAIIQSLTIGGSLVGAGGTRSGRVHGVDGIGTVKIFGDVIGGTQVATGEIFGDGLFKSIEIGGSLIGGIGENSGSIFATSGLKKVVIKGNVNSGAGAHSGNIVSDGYLDSVSILGSANGSAAHNVVISAASAAKKTKTADVAIKSVKIVGSASFLDILAGYSGSTAADIQPVVDGDAQIGAVSIGGNASGLNIAAGINPVDGKFGNGNDVSVAAGTPLSTIGSILIKGTLDATADPTDSFAFTAQLIKAAKINGVKQVLVKGAGNDNLSPAADTVLKELA